LPEPHQGLFVRGRLDVPTTALLRGSGRQAVASITRARSLNHPAVRAIVCAERALATALAGQREWRSDRVRQTLPPMRAAVGGRPRLPRVSELLNVRYTPITLPFRRVALLSHRIATRLGYGANDEEGSDEGILIDVAELWELFVLNCTRQAVPSGWRVEHGARSRGPDALLRARDGEHTMGRLRPDLIIRDETEVVAILDAKYKRLTPTRERPDGVAREDLYQLAAYATRFKPSTAAALVYPRDAGDAPVSSTAERLGPWTDGRVSFKFQTLPTDIASARHALGEQILR
jgi:5-methylcytosine-specific restriction enzyme subunit McrC